MDDSISHKIKKSVKFFMDEFPSVDHIIKR